VVEGNLIRQMLCCKNIGPARIILPFSSPAPAAMKTMVTV